MDYYLKWNQQACDDVEIYLQKSCDSLKAAIKSLNGFYISSMEMIDILKNEDSSVDYSGIVRCLTRLNSLVGAPVRYLDSNGEWQNYKDTHGNLKDGILKNVADVRAYLAKIGFAIQNFEMQKISLESAVGSYNNVANFNVDDIVFGVSNGVQTMYYVDENGNQISFADEVNSFYTNSGVEVANFLESVGIIKGKVAGDTNASVYGNVSSALYGVGSN